jgi:hypothetical protein
VPAGGGAGEGTGAAARAARKKGGIPAAYFKCSASFRSTFVKYCLTEMFSEVTQLSLSLVLGTGAISLSSCIFEKSGFMLLRI